MHSLQFPQYNVKSFQVLEVYTIAAGSSPATGGIVGGVVVFIVSVVVVVAVLILMIAMR